MNPIIKRDSISMNRSSKKFGGNSGIGSIVKLAVTVPGAVVVIVVAFDCVFVIVIPMVPLHEVKW